MHDQVKVADGEIQELAVPSHIVDDLASESGDGRVERLECGKRHQIEPRDDPVAEAAVKILDQRVHLGEFGHAPSLIRLSVSVQRRDVDSYTNGCTPAPKCVFWCPWRDSNPQPFP